MLLDSEHNWSVEMHSDAMCELKSISTTSRPDLDMAWYIQIKQGPRSLMCSVLSCAVPLLPCAKFRKRKGGMRFRASGTLWAVTGRERGKELPKYPYVVFRSMSHFHNSHVFVHTHIHTQTLCSLSVLSDSFPAEIWPWLCTLDTAQLSDSTWKVCYKS